MVIKPAGEGHSGQWKESRLGKRPRRGVAGVSFLGLKTEQSLESEPRLLSQEVARGSEALGQRQVALSQEAVRPKKE